ncbi:MAG: Flp pilus assembly protein TadD [Janthinobacterium sp.]
MKNVFAIVTLSAVLSACAAAEQVAPTNGAVQAGSASSARDVEQAGQVTSARAAAQAVPGAAEAEEGALPNVELSSDLLYKLVRAELEFKTGRWQGAYVSLLAIAQQTRDPRIAQRATDIALFAKQDDAALAAIRLWRELAPESEAANQFFLAFVVLSDNLVEAEPIFYKRLQRARPQARAMVMFQMQQMLSRVSDKSAVFALQERVLAPYHAMPEAHLVLAQGAYASGDGARAVREAQQALALKPDSELAVLTLAQVRGDADAARALLLEFLDKHADAGEVRVAYARMLVEKKEYAPARKQFLTLLEARPDSLATLYSLGVISMQLSDVAAAQSYFKQFLAAHAKGSGEESDASKVLIILSQIAEERLDVDAALGWLEKVSDNDARAFFSAGVRRAQLLARRGDLDGARTLLATLQGGDADEQVRLLLADAQILRDGGFAMNAYAVLENGAKRFPDNAELLYDFALAAEKMKRLDVMESTLRRVIRLAPDNQHAYNALGYALAEHNIRLPEARALIGKALALAPGDPFIMDSMGWVEFRMGNLSRAEQLLRSAYALRNDPEIAVHLGEVLWQKGDQADARKLWGEAMANDPQNAALKHTLARLNLSL